jgi:hypothetical protein
MTETSGERPAYLRIFLGGVVVPGTVMMKSLFATLLSTSVMCAILMSSIARAQLPKGAATPGGTSVVVQVDTVEKKPDVATKKDAAAPFEAMKKAMVEAMQRKPAQPQPKVRQEVRKQPLGQAMLKKAMPKAARPNLDAQVQQFTQQFRPILRAEHHVVRIACGLTPEQRKAIARAGEQALRDVARKYLETMRRPMTMAQRAALDPRRLIQEGLAAAVKAQLPPEQAARYQDELAKRQAARKQVAVRNLVARLDHDLILSPEQRNRLSESLSSHWDDSWAQSLEMFVYNSVLPPIPDPYVVPYLSEAQKRIWRSTQKTQGFFGHMAMFGGMVEEDPAEDEELKEARLAASKAEKQAIPEVEKLKAMQQMELMRAQLEMEVRMNRIEQVKEKPATKTP